MSQSSPVLPAQAWHGEIRIPAEGVQLRGALDLPAHSRGLVLFAHGSGSSRHGPRNRRVARTLHEAGLGTLLFDLLTTDEERAAEITEHLRFDISFLAARLQPVARWANDQDRTAALRLGYFGSSTGAAAAFVAAAYAQLRAVKRLEIVPGATHLFEESGTLSTVAELAARWFVDHLPAQKWQP